MSTSPTRPVRPAQARATSDIGRHLHALLARESHGAFIEARYRHRDAMSRHFFARTDTFVVARTIARLGLRSDVYVGVVPRHRHAGGNDELVGLTPTIFEHVNPLGTYDFSSDRPAGQLRPSDR